ncbi:hypothetical protein OG555_13970 [Kribbella sp. NBC_01484]|uniref:hypothetical protein n=1 Tax=Kribbella sp. NBC_01484 TaxID=2903579 RepID=UPI002E369240|nr:hypothetical protein [Kribbella sp. NBC_01484]
MCGPTNVACHIGEGFQAVAENGLKALTKAIGEAAMEAMNGVATFWIEQPTPTLVVGADGKSPRNSEMVAFLQGNVLEIAAIIFILAVLVAGIRTAWEQRAQPLQQLLKATLVFVAVSAAGAATLQLLSEYSDWFAQMIIKSVLPEDSALGPALGGLVLRGSLGPITGDQTASLMTMLIGMFVIIGGLVQVVLMVIRSALLILLAGTFPLAAAATNTEIGKAWFKKYCGWALAFVAYKPAAALIYAAAMKMNQIGVGGSGNTFVRTATGLMMLFLAIFALPALLRFMVPVTAAVAGGSAGMGTAAADPGGMATGAINIGRSAMGRLGGSGGSSGGGGASGAIAAGPAGAGLAVAGAAVNGGKKLAGGVAGAAAHSAGETGGGSVTPTSSVGPMSRSGSGARSSGARSSGSSGSSTASSGTSASATPGRIPEPAGPNGAW